MGVKVKNTFLDFTIETSKPTVARQRSSSVPHACRLCSKAESSCEEDDCRSATDGGIPKGYQIVRADVDYSLKDSDEVWSDCDHCDTDEGEADDKSKNTLCFVDMVGQCGVTVQVPKMEGVEEEVSQDI